jgi:hypothetical protein
MRIGYSSLFFLLLNRYPPYYTMITSKAVLKFVHRAPSLYSLYFKQTNPVPISSLPPLITEHNFTSGLLQNFYEYMNTLIFTLLNTNVCYRPTVQFLRAILFH